MATPYRSPSRATYHVLPLDEEEVLRLWGEGARVADIAARFGVSKDAVRNFAHRRGLPHRPTGRTRTYAVNEAAFDNAENDPVAAYWAGFLMADGNVHQRPGNQAYLQLGLAEEDAAHVEALRAFLGAGHPVRRIAAGRAGGYHKQPMAHLSVSSLRLATALARYGVVPRKTATARVLLLEDSRDFWRGVVDGDGHFAWGRSVPGAPPAPSIGFAGAEPLVLQFRDFVRAAAPGCKANICRIKGIWSFIVTRHVALAVTRLLYDECAIALPRKLAEARRVMAWNPPRKSYL